MGKMAGDRDEGFPPPSLDPDNVKVLMLRFKCHWKLGN